MEIYHNKDKTVTKYLHENGSETCIKIVPSCNFYYNELTKQIEENYTERNKYSVFISFSVGCKVNCKMCYLSLKNYPYKTIPENDIYSDVLKAIRSKIEDFSELKNKYIKLCWMGMGDAFYNLKKVNNVTKQLIKSVLYENLAVGVDSIDIGTTLPLISKYDYYISELNCFLNNYNEIKKNPNNNHKSIVRIFYSLHSILNRKSLIPFTVDTQTALNYLIEKFSKNNIDVIFHQIFLDGINDSNEEINTIYNFFNKTNLELRILRYNECNHSPYKESKKFTEIIKKLNNLNNIKYQISPGSEIKAACGQFIMKNFTK